MIIEETIINVIFDPAKGALSVSSREAIQGKPLGALPVPTRAGFAFAGWYLDGKPVTEAYTVESDEDIRLVAHWTKKEGSKKTSMYKKQKTAAIVLSVVTVVLILALILVNQIVAIYGLTDVYYDENGTEYTEKYYVKKKDGVYGLYDRSGKLMDTDKDGNYFAKSGNLYAVDAETGEFSLYAIVDYDAASGEELNNLKTRVMMYKRISQDNTQSIEVTNQYGTYKFYQDDNGFVQIAGTEDDVVSYDAEVYASLWANCGYMLTLQKLDFSSEHTPRLADGSVDYSAYGLTDRYNEKGELIYSPAIFTITGIPDNESKVVSHTVKVGDAIVSGGGYYVQRVGYDAVYIVDAGVRDTVLQPVEAMVKPMIVYPTTSTMYLEVYDFVLAKANMKNSTGTQVSKLDIIAAFTFEELESRNNTLYTTNPYVPTNELMKGYEINDNNASTMLGNMLEMQFLGCRKLGIDKEALAKYGLDGDVYYMSYLSPMVDSKGQVIKDEKGNQLLAENQLLISQKTLQGTYYVASILCDMIVEVDQYYFSFLEWEKSDWYDEYFISGNLAHIESLDFTVGGKTYNFTTDNTLSYAFYQTADGTMATIDVTTGKVIDHGNGSYSYVDKNGDKHEVFLVDFSRKSAFTIEKQKIVYTDEQGRKYEISTTSSNMDIFCKQYTENSNGLLDYVITNTYVNDSGVEKTQQVTGNKNFRKFYELLLWFTIEGDVNKAEFEANMNMTLEECMAQDDSACQAIIRYKLKDMASVMNQFTYVDENGKVVKRWTEDNEMEIVIRLYRYSERKSLLTIEIVEEGKPSDSSNAVGSFYVLSRYVDELSSAAERLLNKELVEQKN